MLYFNSVDCQVCTRFQCFGSQRISRCMWFRWNLKNLVIKIKFWMKTHLFSQYCFKLFLIPVLRWRARLRRLCLGLRNRIWDNRHQCNRLPLYTATWKIAQHLQCAAYARAIVSVAIVWQSIYNRFIPAHISLLHQRKKWVECFAPAVKRFFLCRLSVGHSHVTLRGRRPRWEVGRDGRSL